MPPAPSGATISYGPSRVPDARGTGMAYYSNLIRGASPLGLPDTRPRAPLRRRAPVAWLARYRSLATDGRFTRRVPPSLFELRRGRLLARFHLRESHGGRAEAASPRRRAGRVARSLSLARD